MRARTAAERIGRLAAVCVFAFLGVGVLAGPASAAGCGAGPRSDAELRSVEQGLLSLANGARAAAGAGSLGPHGEVTRIARDHAARMASQGVIFHNDAYFASIRSLGASTLAENVGKGCSTSDLHAAFMVSPGHRSNILNASLTHAGFAAATDATGTLYVVQGYAAFAAPAPPPPPPPPAPAAAPPPAAPPVQHSTPSPPRPVVAPPPAPAAVTPEPVAEVPEPEHVQSEIAASIGRMSLGERAALLGAGPPARVRSASLDGETSLVGSVVGDSLPAGASAILLVAFVLSIGANGMWVRRRRRSGVWSVTP